LGIDVEKEAAELVKFLSERFKTPLPEQKVQFPGASINEVASANPQ
jgi:hypothetical protein